LVVNGELFPEKLMLDQIVTSTALSPFNITVSSPVTKGEYSLSAMFKPEVNTTYVRYAYAIDEGRYWADWKKLNRSRV
jgi:hypothetical protein